MLVIGFFSNSNTHVDPHWLTLHFCIKFDIFRFSLFSEYRQRPEVTVRLSDTFNRPEIIEDGDNMDSLTRGLSTQSQEEIDPFFTAEVSHYIYHIHIGGVGESLALMAHKKTNFL